MNARGNALLGALATIVGLGVVSGSMVGYYENFVRTSRAAFVRSAFTSLEGSVRYMSMQPYAYTCGTMTDISQCTVNPGYFSRLGTATASTGGFQNALRQPFAGAKCPAGQPNCGFLIEWNNALRLVPSGGRTYGLFQGRVTYEGEEVSIKPTTFPNDPAVPDVLRESVPIEVLQAQVIDCNLSSGGTTPVFAGFQANGRPNCVGFDRCPQGQYVSYVNFDTMRVTCSSLSTPDKSIDCSQGATGQRQTGIASMDWRVADGQVTHTCTQMPQPPLNESQSNCPPTAHQEPDGSCAYANRWCRVGSPDGTPTLGFDPNPGARHVAGCGTPDGTLYPPGAVLPSGINEWVKCMSGPYDQFPLPDSMCPGSATPPATCPDQVYQDTQAVSSGMQNGYVELTVDFQSAVDRIPANCRYDNVILDLRQFGSYAGSCSSTASFNLTPGGGPGFFGFMGPKTSIVTAVVNGGRAALTDRVAGFGSCGGNPCAACLSDVRVTVRSVPR